MDQKPKLGSFLQEVSNWYWDEFVRAEKNKQYTTNQAIIFALIRACTLEKIDAIRIALNRLDGKLKTPIKIEMPKVYYLYPNAKATAGEVRNDNGKLTAPKTDATKVLEGEVLPPAVVEKPEQPDLATMTLRETLTEMSDYPRDLPEGILKLALETEQWLKKNGEKPFEIPRVKSVVAAHLLTMAQNRNIDALYEVFDQIDGKLAETIQVIGDDIFITSYLEQAPPGAYLNDDGILQLEAGEAQDLWAQKLGAKT